LLTTFKYLDFLTITIRDVFGIPITPPGIPLPPGISFFTFTQIAFLVDSYKSYASEYKIRNYMLFISYFPHLIAGPILHHRQMMPQFADRQIFKINYENVSIGLALFIIGLSKKMLLADPISFFADPVFAASVTKPAMLAANTSWIGALAYTFQLYFDFSGYSDMAVGLSLLFNVRLPINFMSPYKASNISEFWRRWHISLSTFLRDYLYIPLGGNRKGEVRRYVNLILTMLLGGLWHGANWTFVVWGLIHGGFLAIYHFLNPKRDLKIVGTGLTFIIVVLSWVVFRAENLHSAGIILKSMFGANGAIGPWKEVFGDQNSGDLIRYLVASSVIVWALPNPYEVLERYYALKETAPEKWMRLLELHSLKISFLLSALFFICMLTKFGSTTSSPFLYFQF
jgi:alginate O-acetyltransferase complex protein AlgI